MKQLKALEAAIAAMEKKFGDGAIIRLGDKPHVAVDAISTTSISLNQAIGIGGVPRGRITEIYGPEASGKTTLALHIVAEAQKTGEAAYVDVEHALDAEYAQRLGVDTDRLFVSQPGSGEEALEITEALVRSGEVAVLVVDSVAALVPTAELNGSMGDAVMGSQARLMSQAMRKLTAIISESKTCVIFINQLRSKLGVFFGNPETTTGGAALKYYASVRLDIRRIGALKDGDTVVGNRTKVKVVKNKVGSPYKECEFDLIYGEGISREGDLLDVAEAKGIVKKSGAWYSVGSVQIGQGKEKARAKLKEDKVMFEELLEAVTREPSKSV